MTRLSQRLKAGTADHHHRLDTQPFFQALQAGTLPATSAVGLLRSLAIVHAVVERALSQTTDAGVAAIAAHAPGKVPLLAAASSCVPPTRSPLGVPEAALSYWGCYGSGTQASRGRWRQPAAGSLTRSALDPAGLPAWRTSSRHSMR